MTPADCDLRDFAFMPLDVVRLRDSDLAATESAESFRAAVMLWCASWHQLPAASLPNDDRVLANLAGYGRVVKEWMKEREGALRGWALCTDGRLYHPVVAEKAMEAWRGKLERLWRTECARIKKHNQRHNLQAEPPEFEAWLSCGRPQGQMPNVPEDKKPLSLGQDPPCPALVPNETASKGQREGQGQGQLIEIPDPNGSSPSAPPPAFPPCPVRQLVALFVDRCVPAMPKPRIELWKDSQGADAMRHRWKWLLSEEAVRDDGSRYATDAAEAVDWFGRFFDSVQESDFLTGRSGNGKFDLSWLMKRENFMKVVQGNYKNRGAA